MCALSSEAAVPSDHSRDHTVHNARVLRSDYHAQSQNEQHHAQQWCGDDERESQHDPQIPPLNSSSRMPHSVCANDSYYPNASAESLHQCELDVSKGSLGFIMNQRGRSGADYIVQPAPLVMHNRPDELQFLARAVETETRGHEHGASSIFCSLAAPLATPSTAPIHALAPTRFSGMYDQHPDSSEPRRVLLLPPLDSRRSALSIQSNRTAVPEPSQTHPSPPEPPKPVKKPAKKRKSTAKSLSYEEKRKSRACKVDGCENYIINRGLCFRHGGGKKCSEDGCTSSAKNAGKCWKHGGSVKCLVDGCERRGKSRGFCWAHGGGTKCSDASCTKVAVSNGYCWAHGGGKRCAYEGCKIAAYERTYNYCAKHHDQLKDGNETLEV